MSLRELRNISSDYKWLWKSLNWLQAGMDGLEIKKLYP